MVGKFFVVILLDFVTDLIKKASKVSKSGNLDLDHKTLSPLLLVKNQRVYRGSYPLKFESKNIPVFMRKCILFEVYLAL